MAAGQQPLPGHRVHPSEETLTRCSVRTDSGNNQFMMEESKKTKWLTDFSASSLRGLSEADGSCHVNVLTVMRVG